MSRGRDISAGRAFVELFVKGPFQKQIRGIRNSFKSLGGDFAGAFRDVGAAMTNVAGKGLAGALFAGTGLAGAVKMASDLERVTIAYGTLLKSDEAAESLVHQIRELGKATPLFTDELLKAGKMLVSYGFETEVITDNLRRLGDIAEGSGSSIADLAFLFGTARTQGRLFARDIHQFTNRGIPLLDAFMKTTGKTGEEIFQMAEEGELRFGDLQKAIEAMTDEGGAYHGLMERISQTFAGKLSTAIDEVRMLMVSIGDTFLPILLEILEMMRPIIKNITTWVEENRELVMGFGKWTIILGSVSAAVLAVGSAFGTIASIATAAVSTITLALTALATPVVGPIAMVAIALGSIAAQFVDFREIFTNLVRDTKWGLNAVFDAILDGDLEQAFEIATNAIQAIWKGMLMDMEIAWVEFTVGFSSFFSGWKGRKEYLAGQQMKLDKLYADRYNLMPNAKDEAARMAEERKQTKILQSIEENLLADPFILRAGP